MGNENDGTIHITFTHYHIIQNTSDQLTKVSPDFEKDSRGTQWWRLTVTVCRAVAASLLCGGTVCHTITVDKLEDNCIRFCTK